MAKIIKIELVLTKLLQKYSFYRNITKFSFLQFQSDGLYTTVKLRAVLSI